MKAIITVKRITEYSSVVEMDETEFSRLSGLLNGDRQERQNAERELNKKIDVKDWQSDDFESLEDFERFEE